MTASIKARFAAAFLATSALFTAAAHAQDYPSRPVRVVGPFGAGGSGDIAARSLAEYLSKRWNQSVIVENRPGGGGLLGANEVKRAASDGYTLLYGYDGVTSFDLFLKDSNFDAMRDLSPISLLVRYPLVLLSSASLPAKNVPELIAYAKANPAKANFGTITNSPSHLYGLVLEQKAGIRYTMVPYSTAAALTAAVLTGEVQLTMSFYGSFQTAIREGKVNALAVATAKPVKVAPGVPTFQEHGIDINAAVWFALFAPPSTPAPIIARLASASADWTQQSNVIQMAAKLGMELVGSTPEELARVVQEDTLTRAEAARLGKIQRN